MKKLLMISLLLNIETFFLGSQVEEKSIAEAFNRVGYKDNELATWIKLIQIADKESKRIALTSSEQDLVDKEDEYQREVKQQSLAQRRKTSLSVSK